MKRTIPCWIRPPRPWAAPCGWMSPWPGTPTFQIGGPADRFLIVENAASSRASLAACGRRASPIWCWGRAPTCWCPTRASAGRCSIWAGDFKKVEVLTDGRTLRAGAGAPLALGVRPGPGAFPHRAGICLGHPGLRGGRRLYGRRRLWRRDAGTWCPGYCTWGPTAPPGRPGGRSSASATGRAATTGGEDIITAVEFTLQPGDPAAIAGKMEELMAGGKTSSPTTCPAPGASSSGPRTALPPPLIEQCGLKGRRVGGAQVSEKHAGFIVKHRRRHLPGRAGAHRCHPKDGGGADRHLPGVRGAGDRGRVRRERGWNL